MKETIQETDFTAPYFNQDGSIVEKADSKKKNFLFNLKTLFASSVPVENNTIEKTILEQASNELAQAEYEKVREKYINTPQWMKAPNGKDTNLTEKQWIQVRTESFKNWFGDWELASKGNLIDNLFPVAINNKHIEKDNVIKIYKELGNGKNRIDGREVRFVNSALGKILRHKGFDTSKIIPYLKRIFESSIPIYSENVENRDFHKTHSNFKGYNNYLGKIRAEGKEYFVRFTTQELNAKQKTLKDGFIPNEMHSTFISDIEIYNTASAVISGNSPATNTDNSVDERLKDFFNKVNKAKENTSKIVDENGEPMVMYHGTQEKKEGTDLPKFDTFSKDKLRDLQNRVGFFFGETEGFVKHFGTRIMPNYLTLKNSKIYKTGNLTSEELELEQNLVNKTTGDEQYFAQRLLNNTKEYTDAYDRFVMDIYHNAGIIPFENRMLGDFRDAKFLGIEQGNVIADKFVDTLKSQGYDGIIIQGTIADANSNNGEKTNQYIVFDPNQIKSSTDNSGYFDTDDNNIYHQTAKKKTINGYFDSDLKVIVLGENLNNGTLPHEMAHFFLDRTFELWRDNQGTKKFR